MFISLKLKNFLSFKDEKSITLATSNKIRDKKNLLNNFFSISNAHESFDILKSCVVFWPNSSGKTNIFKAMNTIKDFVMLSFQSDYKFLPFDFFRLNTENKALPISFELEFIIEKIRYIYQVEIFENKILAENLYYFPNGNKRYLFERDKQKVRVNKDFDSQAELVEKQNILRENALLVSTMAHLNWEVSRKIKDYFTEKINVISVLYKETRQYTFNKIKNDDSFRKKIERFLQVADMQIESIEVTDKEFSVQNEIRKVAESFWQQLPEKNIFSKIISKHKRYNATNDFDWLEDFDFDIQESEWTKQLFMILWPILDTLEGWKVLFIDEMNAKLHPLLLKFIINLFHHEEINKKNAQLVFNTHDTNLLDLELFRRDQIWFTEKDKYWASDLFCLLDFGIRKNANAEDMYLMGLYGAIPFIDDYKNILND